MEDRISGMLDKAANTKDNVATGSIFEQLVEKAAGKFLWVRPVVAHLGKRLRNTDTIPGLKIALHTFQQDFEALYSAILELRL